MTGPAAPCIGLLYCGDLGSALGRTLRGSGVRVVTTCEGRSAQTRQRAVDVGAEILPTLEDVTATADIVLSAVLPKAAHTVARQFADRRGSAPREQLYVDMNSVDEDTLLSINRIISETDAEFVDATVHGGAARLEEFGVMFLSGTHASEVETLFRERLRVRLLGPKPGDATRLKLLLAGMSKGLNVLFLEMAVLACRSEMLDVFLPECRTFYPGLMTAIDRMLPTYCHHAHRRVTEIRSIEALAGALDAPREMIRGAANTLQQFAGRLQQAGADADLTGIEDIVAAAAAVHLASCNQEGVRK